MMINGNAAQNNGQVHPTGPGFEDLQELARILRDEPGSTWSIYPYVDTLAKFRHNPPIWAQIKASFKELGLWPKDLEQAIDHLYPHQEAPVDFREPIVTSMDQVTAQPVEWLWYPYLPLGKLVMLDADMQIVDRQPTGFFNFDLDRYKEQLVAGYSRTLPSMGLEVYMLGLEKLGSATRSALAPSPPGTSAAPASPRRPDKTPGR